MIRFSPILNTQAVPGGGPTLVAAVCEFHANEGIDDTGPTYEWGDQSGNGNDLIQETAARQASDDGDDGWLFSGGFPVSNFYFGASTLGPIDIEGAFTKLIRIYPTTEPWGGFWTTENWANFGWLGDETNTVTTVGGCTYGISLNAWINLAHTYDGVDAHQLISITDGPSSTATVRDTATATITNWGGSGSLTWVGSAQEEYTGFPGNMSHCIGFDSVLTAGELEAWANTF